MAICASTPPVRLKESGALSWALTSAYWAAKMAHRSADRPMVKAAAANSVQ
jgi:hypothetical protein